MFKNIIMIISLCVFSFNVKADYYDSENYSDTEECFDYKNSMERLSCFDNQARGDSSTLKLRKNRVKKYKGTGKWKTKIEPDDIDKDRKIVTLSLKSKMVKPKADTETATLYIRCKQDETQIYVDWDELKGSEQELDVRVSGRPFNNEKWKKLEDTDADGYLSPKSEKLLVMMTKDHEANFVIRVKDSNDNIMKAVFDTIGLHKSLIPVIKECSW